MPPLPHHLELRRAIAVLIESARHLGSRECELAGAEDADGDECATVETARQLAQARDNERRARESVEAQHETVLRFITEERL